MSYREILQFVQKYPAQILAVSKLQPEERIINLYQQGHRAFAENYVQEAISKQENLKSLTGIEWHFVGSLQKNKVKQVAGQFKWIHSVDSVELAQKIHQEAVAKGLRQRILFQVNLAQEDSKGGFEEKDLIPAIEQTKGLSGIEVGGLMTMPPLFEDPEQSRPYFRRLKELAQQLSLHELSMGTSSDYKVALEEGATMVRLGTILFGDRPHKSRIPGQ